jgi:RNA polymerase sigma factor (TIGR02999 family)
MSDLTGLSDETAPPRDDPLLTDPLLSDPLLSEAHPAEPPPEDAQLWVTLYPELKRIARARLRGGGAPTLANPTGLINEVWLRMAGAPELRDRSHRAFLAYASHAMRTIVLDMVRGRSAARRNAGQRVTLDTALAGPPRAEDALEVDRALIELAAVEPRLSRVVEMRYFGGFTDAEIGAALGMTDRTVRRDWEKARVLLRMMLTD